MLKPSRDAGLLWGRTKTGVRNLFLFQLKNTSVEKKKIPNFKGSKRSLNRLFWRMLELDGIPEIRSVVYTITEQGSMIRCWEDGT
jgi:hypothetical protein